MIMNKTLLVMPLILLSISSVSSNDDEIIGQTPGCMMSDYTLADKSDYVLPFPIGKEYTVTQGNCGLHTHRSEYNLRFSYDFPIPIGGDITAVRNGEVINLDEQFPNDTNDHSQTNWIGIKHEDGTIAVYLHLNTKGVFVEIGDEVKQGEIIGISGSSGYTEYRPHLHFHITEKEHDTCQLSLHEQPKTSKYPLKGGTTTPIKI